MKPIDGRPDPRHLKALVRAIVSTAAPERIILFGSAARGEMHADSDIDLLVVKRNCRTLATAAAIYGNLPVGAVEADITVMRPEQLDANARCPGTFVPRALAEGKTIYAKTAIDRPGGRARSWLRPARNRLGIAKEYNTANPALAERCEAAHASAEIALKGLITAHGAEYPDTHNIEKLFNTLQRLGEDISPRTAKSATTDCIRRKAALQSVGAAGDAGSAHRSPEIRLRPGGASRRIRAELE